MGCGALPCTAQWPPTTAPRQMQVGFGSDNIEWADLCCVAHPMWTCAAERPEWGMVEDWGLSFAPTSPHRPAVLQID